MPAGAQNASVANPGLGFVYDPSAQAVRAIRGIPGAALIDDAVDAGFAITSAALSPGHDFALAVAAGDSQLRLVRFAGMRVRTLDGAMASPDRIVFSPGGFSALLYSNSGRLQLVTGLPDGPAISDLDASIANPAAMAVSDDGAFTVLSGGSAVRLLSSDGTASTLALPGATALAFRRNSHDLLAAAGSEIYLVHNPGPNPDYRLVYSGEQSDGPVAIQFSWDGARAWTAADSGALAQVELDSGRRTAIPCACRAAALEPMAARNVFRLTPAGDSPVMLLDASGAEPRVLFVPGGRTSREDGSNQ
jgi:hypothetical protein